MVESFRFFMYLQRHKRHKPRQTKHFISAAFVITNSPQSIASITTYIIFNAWLALGTKMKTARSEGYLIILKKKSLFMKVPT
jgi:hypothetical protein